MFEFEQWQGFQGTYWKKTIDVRTFIQKNYTPYEGDDSFLAGPTQRTRALMEKLDALLAAERANNGLLDIDRNHKIAPETIKQINDKPVMPLGKE